VKRAISSVRDHAAGMSLADTVDAA
jgi:hypothetical protein